MKQSRKCFFLLESKTRAGVKCRSTSSIDCFCAEFLMSCQRTRLPLWSKAGTGSKEFTSVPRTLWSGSSSNFRVGWGFIIISVISDDVLFLLWLQGMPSVEEMAFYSVVWWWRYRQRGLTLPSEGNISRLSDAESMWFKSVGFLQSGGAYLGQKHQPWW